MCDSCARGRGRDLRETPHDWRRLHSAVHGWEMLAPGRWCWQEAGIRQAPPHFASAMAGGGVARSQGNELHWLLYHLAPVREEPAYCVTHAQRTSLFLTFGLSVILSSPHLGRGDIRSHFHQQQSKECGEILFCEEK